jgi:Ni/Co efflux regulator RcnB
MRRFLISLLLASVASTPALAGPRDHQSREDSPRVQARVERQQSSHSESRSESKPTRSERSQPQEVRTERNVPQGNSDRTERVNVQRQAFTGRGADRVDTQRNRADFVERNRGRNGDSDAGQRIVTPRNQAPRNIGVEERQQIRDRVDARQQARDRAQARDFRQSNRPTPNVMRHRNRLVVSDVPRPGTQPRLRTDNRRSHHVNWNGNWRKDHRYDWRHHRNRHRSLFHLGFYFDPYGWGYQPFSIGYRLWPNYYSSRYWINDPYMYRLPYAPPGTRWIRYWNDALLVDVYTGEVVDEIPNFFW